MIVAKVLQHQSPKVPFLLVRPPACVPISGSNYECKLLIKLCQIKSFFAKEKKNGLQKLRQISHIVRRRRTHFGKIFHYREIR